MLDLTARGESPFAPTAAAPLGVVHPAATDWVATVAAGFYSPYDAPARVSLQRAHRTLGRRCRLACTRGVLLPWVLALAGCGASTFEESRFLRYEPGEDCPDRARAEYLLRNRRGEDELVQIDDGPRVAVAVECTYEVTYAESRCPAPTTLAITRAGVHTCPSLDAVIPALIEVHGLASSPCASVVAQKLLETAERSSCVYRVTAARRKGGSTGMSWVVLH